MFSLYKRFRRSMLLKQPLGERMRRLLYDNNEFLRHATSQERIRVEQTVKVILAEKYWEGCGGFKISDVHKLTIAAQIARISLHWSEPDYFDEVKSILVYPEVYVAKSQVAVGHGVHLEQPSTRIGEAWYRGPVVLAWNDVIRTARGIGGPRNVVIHEFAHFLDMRNGVDVDGIPPIESNDRASDWIDCLHSAYSDFREQLSRGIGSVIDPYGATSISEFFAVALEVFYEAPMQLRDEHPRLYQQLADYFRPASGVALQTVQ